ncbi:MAG: isocitrate lyase/phosphoenolpyruvate mutase family protein [Rhodospirillaceae bacterium]|jgi:2-methylisocitrate lyase-like PEP mutase family enzyme|nr:isocitrate lyase/phosphoenolpyruvate mutase family protein [Rhodospirillaceae bacterium]MBT5455040.1 isocitrate lyase/phosphoenolpyruvate mutase family protein [Rhodospirillaceae bacterium]
MTTQKEKAAILAAMHQGDDVLVLPNAWDVASARVLVDAGFEAIATTSGGCAFSLGYCDGEHIGRDGMLDIVKRMANAVDVPVSADVEAGYGPTPEDVALTIQGVIDAGAVGANIEDTDKTNPGHLVPFDLAVDRIAAGKAAADKAGVPVVINARVDGFHFGKGEAVFDDVVKRANAYLKAGAACVFVPFISDGELIGRVAAAIDGPVNVLAGPDTPSVPELKKLGVRRVTVGSGFAKAALSLVQRGAEELKSTGTFEFTRGVLSQPEVHRILTD